MVSLTPSNIHPNYVDGSDKGSKKIGVAFLIDVINTREAGTEKQLIEVISRLDKTLFKLYLICLKQSAWLEQNELPCTVYTLGYKGFFSWSFIAVLGRYIKLLRHHRFDIVHTFFEDSYFVGFLGKILSKSPHILLTSRRDLGLGSEEPWYHILYRFVRPIINRQYDGLVANSKIVKNIVARKEKFSLDKIKVIYNGVNLPSTNSNKPSIFQNIKADIWIGITANLKPIKRLDILLRSISLLKKNAPALNVHVVVMGEGEERSKLEELSKKLNVDENVHFLGRVSDIYSHLRYVDIGVLCSDREGLSNAILEYMACGLPVVTTSVGGGTELVNSSNGFCVAPGVPDALSSALEKLVANPKLNKELGLNSFKKVTDSFLWQRIIQDWQKYYINLVCQHEDIYSD